MREPLNTSIFYRGLSYTLIFLLTFPAFASSIKFRLKERTMVRQEKDGVLKKIQVLPQGTVVEIPEELVPKEFHGEKRDEMALLRWLRTAGGGNESSRFQHVDGKIKRDYFAPIRVVSAPHDKSMEGRVGEVAIRYLARKGGLELVVAEPAPFIAVAADMKAARKYFKQYNNKITALEEKLKASRRSRLEQIGDVRNFVCTQLRKSDALTTLENDLSLILAKVKAEHKRRVEESFGSTANVMINVERTCNIDEFKDKMISASRLNLVPPELMFPMMHAESSGSCDAVNYEQNGTVSVGLFQINSDSSKYSYCGTSYPNRFKDPKCLENSETNINEALRIIRSKYKVVNEQDPPVLKAWDLMSERERDYWRKAVAAYNGGQGYVYQAYNDIMSFNKKYGTDLDADDWRNRRLFFFRRGLEANGAKYFNNPFKYRRSLANAISNVTHTEVILGVEPLTSSAYQGPGLIERWTGYLSTTSHYLAGN